MAYNPTNSASMSCSYCLNCTCSCNRNALSIPCSIYFCTVCAIVLYLLISLYTALTSFKDYYSADKILPEISPVILKSFNEIWRLT